MDVLAEREGLHGDSEGCVAGLKSIGYGEKPWLTFDFVPYWYSKQLTYPLDDPGEHVCVVGLKLFLFLFARKFWG